MKRRSDERGAAMVFFVVTIVVLLGMAAFAVDLGLLFAERRQDQSAADTGVLSGALDLTSGVATASETAAAIARQNLDTTYSDSEWSAAWAACSDPGALTFTGEVLGTATSCISADGLGTFRMVLPDQEVPTAFAGVLGFDSFTSSATAEAELVIQGIGGVLPFAVLGSAQSGGELCLRSSSGGTATPPCDGSQSGNFGALEVPQWGNPELGTESLPCNLNKSDQLTVNISVGVDHFVRIWDGTTVLDSCAKPFGPNTLPTFQGIAGGLFEGMIVGDLVQGSPFRGRLTRGSTPRLGLTYQGNTYWIDNVPLWEYIDYGKAGLVPPTCTRESLDATLIASGFAATEVQMATCLTDYAAATGWAELFDIDLDGDDLPDIINSSRFGIVPQFIETSFPSGGSGNMRIATYRAVFINGLYFGCNGTTCSTANTPGATTGSISIPNGSSPLDQITGCLLPFTSVADELVENGVSGNLGAYQLRLKS